MTREQFRDDILITMKEHLSSEQLGILKDVLINRLQNVEFTESGALATLDNSNEYYLKMFNAFKSQRLSEKTMNMYNYALKKFINFINKPLVHITSTEIDFFLMKQTCSETTKNNYKRFLSAFFSWLVKKRIITFNPVNEIESFKEVRKPIDHLDVDEMERVRDGCKKPRDRAMIEFLRCTAVRVSEMVNVRVCDVDFSSGQLLVYGEKTKTYRTVMLDKVALGYIRKYLDARGVPLNSEEPLFITMRGNRLVNPSTVRSSLKRIAKDGGVERRLYPHLFRKSCATSIMRRGGTLGDASDYLGHSENTVTGRHYIFKDDSHIINIFNKYVAMV